MRIVITLSLWNSNSRLLDWTARFGEATIGMKFVELSSDSKAQIEDVIDEANVLLSTPEKV